MSIPTLLLLPLRALEGTADSAAAGPDLTRYILVSAAMVLAIGGLGWVLQRKVAGSVKLRAAKRSLRIVDVLSLGGKKKLAVVNVYDRTFVLGVGEKEISVVSELDAAAAESAELVPKAATAALPGLTRAFEAIRARVAEGVPGPRTATNAKGAQERVPAESRKAAGKAPAAQPRVAAKQVPVESLGNGRGLLG